MIYDSKNSYLCKLNQRQDNFIDYNIKKINIKGEINYVNNCIIQTKEGNIENAALISEKKNLILGKINRDSILPKNQFKLAYNPKYNSNFK